MNYLYLSKILEKKIQQQVKFHKSNNLFQDCQSGFRPDHSTVSALAKVLDESKSSMLILLDYNKAFDTLSHELLAKLQYEVLFLRGYNHLCKNYFSDHC